MDKNRLKIRGKKKKKKTSAKLYFSSAKGLSFISETQFQALVVGKIKRQHGGVFSNQETQETHWCSGFFLAHTAASSQVQRCWTYLSLLGNCSYCRDDCCHYYNCEGGPSGERLTGFYWLLKPPSLLASVRVFFLNVYHQGALVLTQPRLNY